MTENYTLTRVTPVAKPPWSFPASDAMWKLEAKVLPEPLFITVRALTRPVGITTHAITTTAAITDQHANVARRTEVHDNHPGLPKIEVQRPLYEDISQGEGFVTTVQSSLATPSEKQLQAAREAYLALFVRKIVPEEPKAPEAALATALEIAVREVIPAVDEKSLAAAVKQFVGAVVPSEPKGKAA